MLIGHPRSGKIGYQLTLKPLEKHFTVVYYEPRGTGKSEVPESLEEYGQDHLVAEIEALREHLKAEKIWIFGHSDQSAIALQYALTYPESSEGLILSGTGIAGTQEQMIARRKESESSRIKESPWFAQVVRDWDYLIKHHTDTDSAGRDLSDAPLKWWCYDEESAQKVIPVTKEISKAGRRKPIDGKHPFETPEERQHYLDLQKRFPEINAPVLILNGKYDTNNPPEFAEKLRALLPNSGLVLIDKAGHFPWIENEGDFFSAMEEWLEER